MLISLKVSLSIIMEMCPLETIVELVIKIAMLYNEHNIEKQNCQKDDWGRN
jgi:hypothetical protein